MSQYFGDILRSSFKSTISAAKIEDLKLLCWLGLLSIRNFYHISSSCYFQVTLDRLPEFTAAEATNKYELISCRVLCGSSYSNLVTRANCALCIYEHIADRSKWDDYGS